MHIGILAPPENFHTRKWAKALRDAGAEVTVFSLDESGDEGSVRIPPTPSFGGKYFFPSYQYSAGRLAGELQRRKVDIINPLNITPFGVWAYYSGFKPMIASAMGADILEYPPKGEMTEALRTRSWDIADPEAGGFRKMKSGMLRNYYRKKVKLALDYANLVTADNQHLADKIKQWFNIPENKVRVLRWGIEPELFEPDAVAQAELRQKLDIKPQQPVVLSPRGAKAIYQGDIILEAFHKLLKEGRKEKFIFLSAGYVFSDRIGIMARELEAEYDNFTFVPGLIGREEMYQLWLMTDVFISAPIYDGYSAAIAEGRYAGAIPVVNAIPSNLEVIADQENGYVIGSFSAAALAAAVDEILSSLAAWQAKVQKPNRQWIEKNSLISHNARTFISFCQELL